MKPHATRRVSALVRHVAFPTLIVWLSACGSAVPAAVTAPSAAPAPSEETDSVSTTSVTREEQAMATSTRAVVHAPRLDADALLAAAGMASYLADHDLRVASIEGEARERWFTREPSGVFLYAERPIETGVEATVRGACQRVPLWDDNVLNGLSFVLSRHGDERAVLEIGQDRVAVTDQRLEARRWQTNGVRGLPMGVIAWDDGHIAFAEGAEIQEVACVHSVRTVSCSADADPWVGPRGHCIDRSLVVRPWRAPFVPHVGQVSPAYPDTYPSLPEGSCEVECEPSACDEAMARAQLPRVPLYAEQDLVLAVFRTQSACRAYASSRGSQGSGSGVW